MKKKKNRKQEDIMLGLGALLVVILLVISLSIDNSNGFILKDISMFFEKIIMYPAISNNESNKNVIEENYNKELQKEVNELKDLLELNKTLTEYEPINSTILSRNKSYWFNTLTIDKGRKSGVKKNMAVITKNGLIGKISKVSYNSSEVKLVTSDDVNFKVSVAIKTPAGDSYAVLNGYDKDTGLIKVTGIDKTTVINKGDVVVTSGLGELFPAGIYIGTVEDVKSDKYDLSKILFVKTYQDFNNVHYVTVLKVK